MLKWCPKKLKVPGQNGKEKCPGEQDKGRAHRHPGESCFLEIPALHTAGVQDKSSEPVNGVLAVKKPKLCSEQHEAARPVLCQVLHKIPHLPGSGVCSPILSLGQGDVGILTAAAASCAGSPWLPPLVGCSAPGCGKSVGDQESWRPPQGPQLSLLPGRPQRCLLNRDCEAQNTHKGAGRGQKT